MAYSLTDVLGLPALLPFYQKYNPVLPDPFGPEFRVMEGSGAKKAYGNQATHFKMGASREAMSRTIRGTKPRMKSLRPFEKEFINIPAFGNVIEFRIEDLMPIQKTDSYAFDDAGKDYVYKQLESFKRETENIKIALVGTMLINGLNYFDENGDILPSSAGAAAELTIDYHIPSSNKGQLPQTGGPFNAQDLIDEPWSDADADIPLQIKKIIDQCFYNTGFMIDSCFYGRNVPTWLSQNNKTKEYAFRNMPVNSAYLDKYSVPTGYLEIKNWRPASMFSYRSSANAIVAPWPDDLVVFYPSAMDNWYETLVGCTYIPTGIGPQAFDGSAINRNTKLVYGDYAFAWADGPIMNFEFWHGTSFRPHIKVPEAIFLADVDFTP